MLESLHWVPTFPFCRIIFLFTQRCGWKYCMADIEDIPDDLFHCRRSLFINAGLMFILAVYLNEVVP
jgi:hypothetical protein